MIAKTHNCSDEIREVNLKVTPARISTLKLFESFNEPVDSQEAISRLKKELDIDRVTVFRILNSFVEKGLLRRLEFGEGKARYELATEDHHHLICQSCGSIEDISDCNIDALENDIKRKKGFEVKLHTLEFYGLCKNCLSRLNRGYNKN